MKTFKLFLAVAVLFLSAVACLSSATDNATEVPPAPSEVPQATVVPTGSSGLIQLVTLAKKSDPVSAAPIEPSTVFDSQAVIHAVVAISNAPADTKFTAAWYVVDVGSASAPNTLITSTDLTADGTRDLDFTLTPTSAWPAGTYRVDISVNGQLDQSATYSVQ
jgi:hypothetical protein